MKFKIIGAIVTMLISCLLFFVGVDTRVLGDAYQVYQVYLDGNKIGLIDSKDNLLNLIDKEQAELKDKYKVDKVYPPTGLNVEKVYTYDNNITDVDDIYSQIKDTEPFRIQGYTITINYAADGDGVVKDPLKIYLLDKDLIKTSLYNVAAAFIGKDNLNDYENNLQTEITDTGEILTSVYFEETITIKEDLISTNEKIFNNSEDLTQYLLYGTNDKQDTYVVKDGEDLQKIADDHSLNIEELLIANPEYPNSKVLLTAGEVLNVGLINPLVSVMYRKNVVEDVNIPHGTSYVDDNTKYTDYKEVTQAGVDGLSRVTEDVIYKNGQIQTVYINKTEVLKSTVDEIITKGTKKYSSKSSSSSGSTYTGSGSYDPYAGGTQDFGWPTLTPYIITSYFEYRWGSHHDGIDISGTGRGSPIYSSTDGTVMEVETGCSNTGWYGSKCGGTYGNHVLIRTSDGKYDIMYGHLLTSVRVSVGQSISSGQIIGYMGSSGSSTGNHLHWEIRYAGTWTALNPCKVAFRC